MSQSVVESFNGLTRDERRHLREWQTTAKAIGIDGVEDLTARPWPCPVGGMVIGVFQAGFSAAQWLVVGQNGTWAVAYCAEGEVSATVNSLADALAVIYPGEPRFDRVGGPDC